MIIYFLPGFAGRDRAWGEQHLRNCSGHFLWTQPLEVRENIITTSYLIIIRMIGKHDENNDDDENDNCDENDDDNENDDHHPRNVNLRSNSLTRLPRASLQVFSTLPLFWFLFDCTLFFLPISKYYHSIIVCNGRLLFKNLILFSWLESSFVWPSDLSGV